MVARTIRGTMTALLRYTELVDELIWQREKRLPPAGEIVHYRGRPATDLSDDELRQACAHAERDIAMWVRIRAEDRALTRLFTETRLAMGVR